MSAPHLNDLNTLRTRAIASGVDVSAKAEIIARRRREAAAASREAGGQRQGVYYWTERIIVEAGNVLVLLLMLVLSNIMPPVAILGVAWAEYARVADGISLFYPQQAGLMALVAVATYLSLLVVQAKMRHEAHGHTNEARLSLRLIWQQVRYFVGWADDWQQVDRTPLQRLGGTLQLVGLVVIVALGTLGSMAAKAGELESVWHEALREIAEESTLVDFGSYIAGALYGLVLLFALHWLVSHQYERFAAIRPDMAGDDGSAAADQAEADYLTYLIERQEAKARAKRQQAQQQQPANPTARANGNGAYAAPNVANQS